jgi:hypothetical protein
MLDYISRAFRGSAEARAEHRLAIQSAPSIRSGLRELTSLQPTPNDRNDEQPIFLLSAGWRAGSTLVQRLVMSDARVLMWGEPYNACSFVQRLAATTIAFRRDWPLPNYYHNGALPKQLSEQWIANLYPSIDAFWCAHRAAFDAMFSTPAREAGAPRWGIKEVRLGSDHAFYLRWLYPRARFLFLYRNPLQAYQSYANAGRSWYDDWPDRPVFTPTEFGAHWRRLTEGYLRDANELDALLIRYEDLGNDPTVIDRVESYLDLRLDRSLLDKKVSGAWVERAHVNRLERWLLRRAVSPLAQKLGYEW